MRRCVILLWILAVLTVPVLALDVLEDDIGLIALETCRDALQIRLIALCILLLFHARFCKRL